MRAALYFGVVMAVVTGSVFVIGAIVDWLVWWFRGKQGAW
jgi:hypothetical protein